MSLCTRLEAWAARPVCLGLVLPPGPEPRVIAIGITPEGDGVRPTHSLFRSPLRTLSKELFCSEPCAWPTLQSEGRAGAGRAPAAGVRPYPRVGGPRLPLYTAFVFAMTFNFTFQSINAPFSLNSSALNCLLGNKWMSQVGEF